MNVVYYTALGKFADELMLMLNKAPLISKPYKEYDEEIPGHLFLIGPASTDIVRLVQDIYSNDKYASILVLASPENFATTKRALQFAPHIGKNAIYLSYTPGQPISGAIENAAARTAQRRSYAKLNLRKAEKNTFQTLNLKLQQFNVFLEQAPIGALMINDAGKILVINNMARKLFQYPEGDGQQITLSLLFSSAMDQVESYLHKKKTPDETLVINRNGFFYEINIADITQEDDKNIALLLIRDVTAQILETQRIHSILEALPQMAWTADPAGNKNFFTTSWYSYTGQDKQSAVTDWINVIHPADRANFLTHWTESLAKGTIFECISRYRQYNGLYRWHLERGTPVKNAANEIILWTGNCTDIHSQIQLKEELENKIKERTISLEKLNFELEQYAHIASHDLQEPLRKISTFISILKTNSGLVADPHNQKYLDKIVATATRMARMLKDLLQFSRVQHSGSFEVVNLDYIIQNVLDDLELVITQKNATVNVLSLITLQAVPIQMYQLLYNLVNNALKFSAPNVSPEIVVTGRVLPPSEAAAALGKETAEQYYQFTVQDNGIGFDQLHAEQIFTIFKRLHTKDAYEGSGIGLALCKKVADFHKGTIIVLSEQGKGTRFTVVLPVEQQLMGNGI